MRTKFGSQISFVFNLLVVVVAVGHLMAPGQPSCSSPPPPPTTTSGGLGLFYLANRRPLTNKLRVMPRSWPVGLASRLSGCLAGRRSSTRAVNWTYANAGDLTEQTARLPGGQVPARYRPSSRSCWIHRRGRRREGRRRRRRRPSFIGSYRFVFRRGGH